jgi:predicted  nucleic acid-binding Zn-ribbon protein
MYAPTEMEQQNETLTRELREAYIRIDTLNSEVNELTKEVKELTELLKECHYRLERKCTPIKGIV